MGKYRLYIISLFVLACLTANAQRPTPALGCVYKPEIDGKVPLRPQLMTRAYTVLPSKYSLKQYCPSPGDQDIYGTCTAWSTTYAARTMCEAISNGWTDKELITKEAFAPIFIYKQLSSKSDCQEGTSPAEALELLKKKGAPKLRSFNVRCADYIPNNLYTEAIDYKIDDYTTLFNTYAGDNTGQVVAVKKALAEEHPVVIIQKVYSSFSVFNGKDLWNGVLDELRGNHAMCVVGYDDDKYGGAFEILNSWGTDWANKGFIWVKYDDFCKNTVCAYDVYLKKKEQPKPTPTPTPQKKYSMSGDMWIVERDGGETPMVINNDDGVIPYYLMAEDYMSGKRFRLVISNHEPAWVYVIASDLKNQVTKLFPYADNVSAYLNYSENDIALPDETHEFELDTTPGTDYFCVLYSQEELNINSIVKQIQSADGTFYQKLRKVLGNAMASKEDVRYVQNDIGFSAKTSKPIVPLVVEITHKAVNVNYQ